MVSGRTPLMTSSAVFGRLAGRDLRLGFGTASSCRPTMAGSRPLSAGRRRSGGRTRAFRVGFRFSRRASHSLRAFVERRPARRQASSTSEGTAKASDSQFSALRVAAISSAPSGEPCAPCACRPCSARRSRSSSSQAIIVGLSDFWASSMAAAIASGSWPSTRDRVPAGTRSKRACWSVESEARSHRRSRCCCRPRTRSAC
jgi:hypothetical protein